MNCPITGQTRYVGKTTNVKQRLRRHFSGAKLEKNHRACWIRSLVSQGLRPEFEMLAQVPETEWPQWEIDYIAFFRSVGCDLVNATIGGESGSPGRKATEETRLKMSAASLGRRHTPESRAKMSVAQSGINNPRFGKKATLATRLKMSAAQKRVIHKRGHKLSPEHRAKLAITSTGRIYSLETRAKISAAHKGRIHTPESRANMRAGHLKTKNNLCQHINSL